MKTLWDMPRGQTAEIAAITQTLPQQIQQRLFEMGFEPGRALTCVQRGPFQAQSWSLWQTAYIRWSRL